MTKVLKSSCPKLVATLIITNIEWADAFSKLIVAFDLIRHLFCRNTTSRRCCRFLS